VGILGYYRVFDISSIKYMSKFYFYMLRKTIRIKLIQSFEVSQNEY